MIVIAGGFHPIGRRLWVERVRKVIAYQLPFEHAIQTES